MAPRTYLKSFPLLVLAVCGWLILAQPALAQDPIRVTTTGAGSGNGSSWGNAATLQDALGAASNGDEIWVASGIYTPGTTISDTFSLPPGVAMYGGFAATETLRSQRNYTANLTILSGDIDGDDVTSNGIVTTTADIVGNNAHHVLVLDGVSGSVITESTVLDGFTVTAGQAKGGDLTNSGGGLYCAGNGSGGQCSPSVVNVAFRGNSALNQGGAMFNNGEDGGDSSPSLTNVTFSGNSAHTGGAMFNSGYTAGNSSPDMVNVTFYNNSAADQGGAMLNWGDNNGSSSPSLLGVTFRGNSAVQGGAMLNSGITGGTSSPSLTNVIFRANYAGVGGGGMYSSGGGGTSNPSLTNVIFSGNMTANKGGAMFNNGEDSGDSSPSLTNVTFGGNFAKNFGGAMYNHGNGGNSSPKLTNVILWGNAADLGGELYNVFATPALSYTLIQSETKDINSEGTSSVTFGPGCLTSDPRFVAPVSATAAPTTTGNYRLQATSPAIDAGNNLALSVTTDLAGDLRFVDIPNVADSGSGVAPIVDMGAYEVPAIPELTVTKTAAPATGIAYHDIITYTVTLSNIGTYTDTALLTDTLSTDTTFAAWSIAPPPGTVRNGDVITWAGEVGAGEALTWMWTVAHSGVYGGIVTNTVLFSGTRQSGAATATVTVAEPPLLYVNADAAPGQDGSTWGTAYKYLQDALTRANNHESNNYEIWVAEGVYYPDQGAGTIANSATMSFTVRHDNVQLYGGFAATETLRTQRNISANLTILSGDIGGDDTPGVIVGDNAYHVLYLDGINGSGITDNTVLDGFTVTAGQAKGSSFNGYGGGFYCAGNGIGGQCSPNLGNVIFSGCSAINGGAMYNNGSGGGSSSPNLVNVAFSGNKAATGGGAIFNNGENGGSSNPSLVNVTFSNNSANSGGGLFNNGNSNPGLTNVILWANTATSGSQMYNASASPVITNSLVQGGDSGSNSGTAFSSGIGNINVDPLFVKAAGADKIPGTPDDDLRLKDTSPAINAGTNSAINVSIDLGGQPRVVKGIVDMGAYENQEGFVITYLPLVVKN